MAISEKLKTALEVLLLAVIAAFVAGTALNFFVDLFWGASAKPAESFHGAFWGAFLAFLFVRISEALNRFYNRARDSRRALGSIQFTLNEAMSVANDNSFVMEQWEAFYEVAKRARATGAVPLFGNRLEPIAGMKSALIDLGSIGLVNELFLLESSIRKLNDSMATWQRMYEDAKTAFVSKNIDVATYLANVDQSDMKAKELHKFIQALMDELVLALAGTRLLLQRKPFLAKVFAWLNPDHYKEQSHPERVREIAKLRGELKEVGKESRERIAAITGTSPTVGKSAS